MYELFSYAKLSELVIIIVVGMQAKLNILFKLAKDLGVQIKTSSPLHPVERLEDTDRLRLSLTDLIDKYEINEELLDEVIGQLNDIKKKNFEIKILESGRQLGSVMELKDIKSRGVDKLVKIPQEVKNQVRGIETQILTEQTYLAEQRKKTKDDIVQENNLLPNQNFRIGLSLLLTIVAAAFVFLGYIASTDERFYDKNFGYWSMLLGGMALLVTLNIFVIRVIQMVRFQLNKEKAIADLAFKFIGKLEINFETIENKLRTRIFTLESMVYAEACKTQLKASINERKALIIHVKAHIN